MYDLVKHIVEPKQRKFVWHFSEQNISFHVDYPVTPFNSFPHVDFRVKDSLNWN